MVQKSIADLISESRRGSLGLLWWIIEPVLYMSVFYLIFVVVFDRGGEDRVSFLLTGLVAWKWFNSSISQCSICIPSHIGLIRQVYIPKYIFPGIILMTTFIKFLVIFSFLIVFLLVAGKNPSAAWFSLPIVIAVQLLTMLALGSFLAAVVPFLPDIKLLIDNGLILLFFLSGVFFDIRLVPEEVRNYFYLNPMTSIIESYRNILLGGIEPNWQNLGWVVIMALGCLALGGHLLRRFDRTYAKVI